MTEAYDEYGNRLYPVTICTICPIENDAEGRAACFDYWQVCEDYTGHTVDSMLPEIVGPIGEATETHSYCARSAYTHQRDRLRGFMGAVNLPFVAKSFVALDDTPETIKAKLSVYIGDSADFLTYLGLEVKRTR